MAIEIKVTAEQLAEEMHNRNQEDKDAYMELILFMTNSAPTRENKAYIESRLRALRTKTTVCATKVCGTA